MVLLLFILFNVQPLPVDAITFESETKKIVTGTEFTIQIVTDQFIVPNKLFNYEIQIRVGKYGVYSNEITLMSFSFLLNDTDGQSLILPLYSQTATYPDLNIYLLTSSFNFSSIIADNFSDEISMSGQLKMMDNTEIYVTEFFEIGNIKIVKDYEPVNVIPFIVIWGLGNVIIAIVIKRV